MHTNVLGGPPRRRALRPRSRRAVVHGILLGELREHGRLELAQLALGDRHLACPRTAETSAGTRAMAGIYGALGHERSVGTRALEVATAIGLMSGQWAMGAGVNNGDLGTGHLDGRGDRGGV